MRATARTLRRLFVWSVPAFGCSIASASLAPVVPLLLMDHPELEPAHGVPFRWTGVGVPANGESFTIEPGASCPPS